MGGVGRSVFPLFVTLRDSLQMHERHARLRFNEGGESHASTRSRSDDSRRTALPLSRTGLPGPLNVGGLAVEMKQNH